MANRNYTPFDQLLMNLDHGLRTVFGKPVVSERPNPADGATEAELSDEERQLAVRLMRINHAGEVAAQALYQGQALTAKLPDVRDKMERAALEENDHLEWCERRVTELGSHTSLLNPLWYGGSLAMGALAGKVGDKWSLGFVAETERQVISHLEEHLEQIPEKDLRSRKILEQMKEDETHHGHMAMEAGGVDLPAPIKAMMQLTSKVMTKTAYWL